MNNYKGALRTKRGKEPYTFNDLLEELRGSRLSRLTPNTKDQTPKKIIRRFVELEIEKINNTDQFL